VAKVARLLWEGRGCAGAEFCFISLAEPSVPAALDKLRVAGLIGDCDELAGLLMNANRHARVRDPATPARSLFPFAKY
jgi:hypothetical protein